MKIDITNINTKNLKLEDLIADAVERKDAEAIAWLREKANTRVPRNNKDGSVTQVRQPVKMYVNEYLAKFHGYDKKKVASKKREDKLNAMFDEALAQIK